MQFRVLQWHLGLVICETSVIPDLIVSVFVHQQLCYAVAGSSCGFQEFTWTSALIPCPFKKIFSSRQYEGELGCICSFLQVAAFMTYTTSVELAATMDHDKLQRMHSMLRKLVHVGAPKV